MLPHQPTSQSGPRARCASVSTHTALSPLGPPPHMRRPTQAIHLTYEVRSMPFALWSSGRGPGEGTGVTARDAARRAGSAVPGRGREGSPCECGRRRIARIVSQGFHRLFGGECSGSSGYIVVAAGREDSRGLGSPMTEFLPRRPRVLGSPRLVALAKEGVPPELGTRVRNPSTTKARGPGETTRHHGPRHIRAQKRDAIELAEPTTEVRREQCNRRIKRNRGNSGAPE